MWGGEGLPLLCHHQKERTKPHAPRGAPSPAGCPRRAAGLRMDGWPGRQAGGSPSPPPVPPLPGTEEARLEREPKDSAPPDPQMLHEHILRGPAPLLSLGSGPRCSPAFAQFADPKVLHFPARPARTRVEGRSRSVALLCCRVGGTGRKRDCSGWLSRSRHWPQVWVLGFPPPPPPPRSDR